MTAPADGAAEIATPAARGLKPVVGWPGSCFTRRLDQPKGSELPGTQGASAPFFSPAGQWIEFFSGDKVNKISLEGGIVVQLGTIGN
jgi:hypothetical protein